MSCFKNQKQSVKIKGIRSLFHFIKSEVPQGSILGPILFNIFINDLLYLLQTNLHNFADDNTILSVSDTRSGRIKSLTSESGSPIDWFTTNYMIVNPDKFNTIIFIKSKQNTSGISVSLRGHWIVTQRSFDLLGVVIDCSLCFKMHVSKLCKSSASQLSALKRLRPDIINERTFKNLIQSFTLSHFNYCPTFLVFYQF